MSGSMHNHEQGHKSLGYKHGIWFRCS